MIKSNEDFDRFYEESIKEVKSIPGLDVKNIAGFGNSVVATKKISKGTKFPCKRSSIVDLRKVPKGVDYYWNGDTPYFISGLGFLCNGSSPSYKSISGVDFNAEMDQESRVVTIIKDLNIGDQVLLNYGDGYFFLIQGVADPDLIRKGRDYYKQNLNNTTMVNQLQNIRERLFDAPREVKESFNNLVQYFDTQYFGKEGKGKGNSSVKSSEVDRIYAKMENNPTSVTVAEMDKINAYDGADLFVDIYRDAKIPNLKSLIFIDGEDPFVDLESNKEFQEAKDNGIIWRTGKHTSSAWVHEYETSKGVKFWSLMGPYSGYYVMPSSLASKFKFSRGKGKGKGKG